MDIRPKSDSNIQVNGDNTDPGSKFKLGRLSYYEYKSGVGVRNDVGADTCTKPTKDDRNDGTNMDNDVEMTTAQAKLLQEPDNGQNEQHTEQRRVGNGGHNNGSNSEDTPQNNFSNAGDKFVTTIKIDSSNPSATCVSNAFNNSNCDGCKTFDIMQSDEKNSVVGRVDALNDHQKGVGHNKDLHLKPETNVSTPVDVNIVHRCSNNQNNSTTTNAIIDTKSSTSGNNTVVHATVQEGKNENETHLLNNYKIANSKQDQDSTTAIPGNGQVILTSGKSANSSTVDLVYFSNSDNDESASTSVVDNVKYPSTYQQFDGYLSEDDEETNAFAGASAVTAHDNIETIVNEIHEAGIEDEAAANEEEDRVASRIDIHKIRKTSSGRKAPEKRKESFEQKLRRRFTIKDEHTSEVTKRILAILIKYSLFVFNFCSWVSH